MTMAALTVYSITSAGVTPVYVGVATASTGDTFSNNGRTFVHVKSTASVARTVTVDSTTNCNYGYDHDVAVAVSASGEEMIGPFPTSRFGTTTTMTYSATGGLTVAAIKI